jgi:hypothetical protein
MPRNYVHYISQRIFCTVQSDSWLIRWFSAYCMSPVGPQMYIIVLSAGTFVRWGSFHTLIVNNNNNNNNNTSRNNKCWCNFSNKKRNNFQTSNIRRSRISSFGIAMGYGLNGPGIGVRFAPRARICLLFTAPRPALGTPQLPIQWVPGGSFPWGKAAGALSWLPPSSAEVKNDGAIPLVSYTSSWRGA